MVDYVILPGLDMYGLMADAADYELIGLGAWRGTNSLLGQLNRRVTEDSIDRTVAPPLLKILKILARRGLDARGDGDCLFAHLNPDTINIATREPIERMRLAKATH